jgi:Ca2+/H+ antiporter
METQRFRISQAGYTEAKKRSLIWSVIVVLVVIIAFGYCTYEPRDGADAIWIGFQIFMILLYVLLVYRTLKRHKAIYGSYAITIDELMITREQKNLMPRSIQLSDITAITKSINGSFTIKGKSNAPADTIVISKLIEDSKHLELLLAGIKSINVNINPTFKEKYGRMISIVAIIPLLGVYLFNNKIVVSICAAIAVVLYVAAFFDVLKNKGGIIKPQRRLWYIVWLLLLVLTISYFKLIA